MLGLNEQYLSALNIAGVTLEFLQIQFLFSREHDIIYSCRFAVFKITDMKGNFDGSKVFLTLYFLPGVHDDIERL